MFKLFSQGVELAFGHFLSSIPGQPGEFCFDLCPVDFFQFCEVKAADSPAKRLEPLAVPEIAFEFFPAIPIFKGGCDATNHFGQI
jgi:hypothetical protein